MYTSIAAVESLGFEHVSHDMCWEKEHIELQPVRNQRQECDRMQELAQHLDCKLRERKRELKRLKKDNEILKEENDSFKKEAKERNMALLSYAPLALHEASDTSLRYAGYMLPKFNGTDPTNFADTWLKMITNNAALFSWSESQTFLAAKMALEGEARHWLIALRRDITNFQDFKVAFEVKFGKKDNSVTKVHIELAKRKKIKGEAVYDYVSDVKYLAKKIDLSDEDTLEYVMLGLPDDEFPKDLIEKFKTLDELENFLMERVEDEVRVPDEPKKDETVEVMKSNKVCYHCKKVGHEYVECKEYVETNVAALFLVAVVFAVMGV